MIKLSIRRPILASLFLGATLLACGLPASAQEDGEEEYKAQIPDVSIYKAMLDANKQTGWVQFREFSGQQLIYFTALQTMHCRLREVRYSINSDTLDKTFPMAKCDPELPFNLPSDDSQNWLYLNLKPGEAQTIAVQAVWDDGSGSEIVVYQPCKNPEATCASIKTIKKAKKRGDEPAPATPVR
ncbi:hypothetical protein MUO32_28420 [Shinella sp. CPCC 101442]|uniref:hypothetical protein n=1 Tax=Shinella sp. CPCC 101442 TaxID=2932265 RepID=UPI002152F8B5|nr:hypothetical protein [Shinella sp. CPCC 101442]MCR6502954.1 hypothetical protein [Shinella sp. CPCC 101442]